MLWFFINICMSRAATLSGVTSSDLYKRFTEEREHILKNKWFLSEKAGKDIGFEKALIDWVMNHRPKWISKLN